MNHEVSTLVIRESEEADYPRLLTLVGRLADKRKDTKVDHIIRLVRSTRSLCRYVLEHLYERRYLSDLSHQQTLVRFDVVPYTLCI